MPFWQLRRKGAAKSATRSHGLVEHPFRRVHAPATIFALLALPFFPVVKRPFLLWLSAHPVMVGVMAVVSIALVLLKGLSEQAVQIIGSIASTLSITFAGPLLTASIERGYAIPNTRRLLRAALLLKLVLAGTIPLVLKRARA